MPIYHLPEHLCNQIWDSLKIPTRICIACSQAHVLKIPTRLFQKIYKYWWVFSSQQIFYLKCTVRSKERHSDLVLSVIPKYLLVSVSTFFFAYFGIIGMMMAK